MKGKLLKVFTLLSFSLIFCSGIFAQETSTAGKILTVSGKTAVIVVGQTAKITYLTTKFTAKEIVLPVAKVTLKEVVLKAAPKVPLFLLKETGQVIEKSIPIGLKLAEKYLKYRLTL